MAQMVARRIGNAEVTGSIPVASFFSILHYINIIADMAELADAPDLGSGGQPCRFDSCYPHWAIKIRTFFSRKRIRIFSFIKIVSKGKIMCHIMVTDKLTSTQLYELDVLIQQCCQADRTRGVSFWQSDMNFIDGFPAFYLMYENNELISIISIFVPDLQECELYANTLPKYRRRGCFLKLYKRAYKTIRAYGIKKIYFLNEPNSSAGELALRKIGAEHESSEYLMSCDISIYQKPQYIPVLTYKVSKNKDIFETFIKGVKAGSVSLEIENSTASIYHVEIEPKFRGMGYGTETLLLMLEYLRKSGCHRAVLHVSSLNEIAYGMYCRHGFVCTEQIDYWIKEVK